MTKCCEKDFVAEQRQAAHIYTVVFLIRYRLLKQPTPTRQTEYTHLTASPLTSVGRMIINIAFSLLHLHETTNKSTFFQGQRSLTSVLRENHSHRRINIIETRSDTYDMNHLIKIAALSSSTLTSDLVGNRFGSSAHRKLTQ